MKNGFTYHVRELHLLLQLTNGGFASPAQCSSCILLIVKMLSFYAISEFFEVAIVHYTYIHYKRTC